MAFSAVVSYRNSTSNHNSGSAAGANSELYLIEILHQTTTSTSTPGGKPGCILSKFYIKPQRSRRTVFRRQRCILSKFYIKPQHARDQMGISRSCILSKFYIKPQQASDNHDHRRCCILSKFYIKPQQGSFLLCQTRVVSYRNSTSNHNFIQVLAVRSRLYLIEILHQTTTWCKDKTRFSKLYLIEILHQTTTFTGSYIPCCSLYLIEILHQTTTVGPHID